MEREHDLQNHIGACFGDHRPGEHPGVRQPAPQLANGEQLPGGPGIRPNLELGLRLIPNTNRTENMHEDGNRKISRRNRVGVALALGVATSSFAQRHDPTCIPHYDTSGAQTAPYC